MFALEDKTYSFVVVSQRDTMFEIERIVHENVHGFECRLLVLPSGKVYACVSDLYKQLGISKKTIYNILTRNEDFESHIIKFNGSDLQDSDINPVLNLGTGFQKGTTYQFIDDVGYNLLIQRINPELVENDEMRGQLIYVQTEMAGIYAKYNRTGQIPSKDVSSVRNVGDVFEQFEKIGNILQKKYNLDPAIMDAAALSYTERETGVSLQVYKNALPAGRAGNVLLRATDIGNEIGIKPSEVNVILSKMGFISRLGKNWIITDVGREYGDAVPEMVVHKNGSKWENLLPKWKPCVVDMVKERIKNDYNF